MGKGAVINILVAVLALVAPALALSDATVDGGDNAAYYYEQLFDDDRLDITIALSFRQLEDRHVNPILSLGSKLGSAFLQDETGLRLDVQSFENEILGCRECRFRVGQSLEGFRFYWTTIQHGQRTVMVYLKLFYPDSRVDFRRLKAAFVRATRQDDVIIYSGHSRRGRGFPDFFAPFSDQGKVFVNDRLRGWVGFEKGYFSPDKYQLLTLISCQTRRYYRDVIRERVWEKDPDKLALILTNHDTNLEDDPKEALALVRGLMARYSAARILDEMERAAVQFHAASFDTPVDGERRLFSADGFFDATYSGVPRPERIEPSRIDALTY